LRRDWGDADVEDHTSLGPTVAQRLEDVWSMSFEKISSLLLVIVVGETMEDYSCKRR
jgi:tartrate dehydratase beta subunit/fumarate hydratase class I family protein